MNTRDLRAISRRPRLAPALRSITMREASMGDWWICTILGVGIALVMWIVGTRAEGGG